jgi:hypothetical protein
VLSQEARVAVFGSFSIYNSELNVRVPQCQ